jgi:cystathionine beta-lyase/cystathionine gamma-synthase
MPDPLTPYGNKPMVTPIVNSVNYHYASFDVLKRITDGEIDGYTYHRDDNPTVRVVEEKIAGMEHAEDCIICTSGMAACTLVYLTTMLYMPPERRTSFGVLHNTVRLSVGIEPPVALIDDLEQALGNISDAIK